MKKFEEYLEKTGEIGFVTQVMDTIVYAKGLPGAKPEEVVVFETGDKGQVLSLLNDSLEILAFSKNPIKAGTKVARTGSIFKVPAGQFLLGSLIDPFGNFLEKKQKEKISEFVDIDIEPKGIVQRKAVKDYFETGVSVVDLMVPIGKGQRELVIGDRKTGKSSFLLQTAATRVKNGDICIYACIGKRKIDIKKIQEFFLKNKIMENVIMVASTSSDPAGLIHTTPYTAMGLAEYFKDKGKNTLVVMDDMSTHAKFYREISLLGKKFPGRNSYPGDIFYVHAKLMERAGNFVTKYGENSITCIPVVETTQGDLSGYIQTNLMSMTDGHLFFDANLFYQGRRPAVNPFLSVTRVGRQTQSELKRDINREIISFLTLYQRVQNFIHFGSELNESARITLQTGDKILKFFNQPYGDLIPGNVQALSFALLWAGIPDYENIEKIIEVRNSIVSCYEKDEKYKIRVDGFVENSKALSEMVGKLKKDLSIINNN